MIKACDKLTGLTIIKETETSHRNNNDEVNRFKRKNNKHLKHLKNGAHFQRQKKKKLNK